METGAEPGMIDRPITLETFLRGMETQVPCLAVPMERLLETFLRGMETLPPWRGWRPTRPLETFLRGMETRTL